MIGKTDTCSVNIMIKIVVILMYLFEYSLWFLNIHYDYVHLKSKKNQLYY